MKFRTTHTTASYMVKTAFKQTNLEFLAPKYNHFMFDCDGVLFHSKDEIGSAFNALRYLQNLGKQVYLFTNATTRTREQLKEKMWVDHQYDELPVDYIYTASYLTAMYLQQKLSGGEMAYVIGEEGFKQELENFGINVMRQDSLQGSFHDAKVNPDVKAVVVGTDFNLSFEKMMLANLYLTENQAELIGTNIDRNDGKERLRPSGGSLTKLIEVSSGLAQNTSQKQPRIMGKPDTWCFDLLRQQHKLEEVDPKEFLFVGDNLSTDILFGNRCGMDTLLVLSGVTTLQKAQNVLDGLSPKETDFMQAEGVPTYIQSLFAQTESIDL